MAVSEEALVIYLFGRYSHLVGLSNALSGQRSDDHVWKLVNEFWEEAQQADLEMRVLK